MEVLIISSIIITKVKTSILPIALTVSTDMVTTLPIAGITILTIMTRSTGITGILRAGALALAGDGDIHITATGVVPGTGAVPGIMAVATGVAAITEEDIGAAATGLLIQSMTTTDTVMDIVVQITAP